MDPALIAQFRQELRRNNINIRTDVVNYAKSMGISSARKYKAAPTPAPVSAAPSGTATPTPEIDSRLDPLKKGIVQNIHKNLANTQSAHLIEPLIKKVQSIQDAKKLETFAVEVQKLFKYILDARKQGPEVEKAVGGIVAVSAAQALPPTSPDAKQELTKDEGTSNDITSKINSLLDKPTKQGFIELAQNYNLRGAIIKDNLLQLTNNLDSDFLIMPSGVDKGLLYPGWGVRKNFGYWTSDEGRVFDDKAGDYFEWQKADKMSVMSPAVVRMQDLQVLTLGQIGLPVG